MTERWVSADAIAKHVGVAKDNTYTRIARRDMPAHRVHRLWKFRVTEVAASVHGSAEEPSSKGSRG